MLNVWVPVLGGVGATVVVAVGDEDVGSGGGVTPVGGVVTGVGTGGVIPVGGVVTLVGGGRVTPVGGVVTGVGGGGVIPVGGVVTLVGGGRVAPVGGVVADVGGGGVTPVGGVVTLVGGGRVTPVGGVVTGVGGSGGMPVGGVVTGVGGSGGMPVGGVITGVGGSGGMPVGGVGGFGVGVPDCDATCSNAGGGLVVGVGTGVDTDAVAVAWTLSAAITPRSVAISPLSTTAAARFALRASRWRKPRNPVFKNLLPVSSRSTTPSCDSRAPVSPGVVVAIVMYRWTAAASWPHLVVGPLPPSAPLSAVIRWMVRGTCRWGAETTESGGAGFAARRCIKRATAWLPTVAWRPIRSEGARGKSRLIDPSRSAGPGAWWDAGCCGSLLAVRTGIDWRGVLEGMTPPGWRTEYEASYPPPQ